MEEPVPKPPVRRPYRKVKQGVMECELDRESPECKRFKQEMNIEE